MNAVLGFPGAADSEESARNSGDLSLIPGSGRSPGEGSGDPFQYSCLDFYSSFLLIDVFLLQVLPFP